MEGTLQQPDLSQATDVFAFPTSFGQQRLWFLHQYAPASPAYNIPTAHRLSGPLNVSALQAALDEILRRHEVLRTVFRLREGRVHQIVCPASGWPMKIVKAEAGSGSRIVQDWRRLMDEEARRPFDLSSGPLASTLLIRLGDQEHVLVVVFHHIVCDGWSVGVFHRELGQLYRDYGSGRASSLPDLPIQYADYSVWQREQLRGENLESQCRYWTAHLAEAQPFLDLPTRQPRPKEESFKGNRIALRLDGLLTEGLRQLARKEDSTLFQLLFASLNTLLARYGRQEDFVIGSPVAARLREETEGLIGFFVNTLALRTDVSGDPTFRELLQRVKAGTLVAYAHQEIPFERLVERLGLPRDTGRTPLVQVVFALQNFGDRRLLLEGLRIESVDVHPAATPFELTWYVYEIGEGLECRLDYRTDLFEAESMRLLLEHWGILLQGIVAQPGAKLSELPLLTEAERSQLILEWNQTSRPYPRDRCVHELFEEQAQAHPNAPAVCFLEKIWSYRELDECAEQIAARLQTSGVVPDQLVGLCVGRSPEMVAALLGILKAGGAYLPLDAALPDERLLVQLTAARPRVLIVEASSLERFRSLRGRQGTRDSLVGRVTPCAPNSAGQSSVTAPGEHGVTRPAFSQPSLFLNQALSTHDSGDAGSVPSIAVTVEELMAAPRDAHRTRPSVSSEHLAYVMYTSGSTGRPKGVMVPHRGVVRLVTHTNYASLTPEETLLQLAPLSFDASTFEIWGALLNGGRLALMPPGPPTPAEIAEAVRRHGVTTLWLTAPLFHLMVEKCLTGLQPLRQLLTGGDVLSPRHVVRALRYLPGCRLINGYGPTENTTFTCCQVIARDKADSRPIPIGRPIANTRVYVLDSHLNPVPVGVPGELCAAGDGVARGYLDDPAGTAERFISDPFSRAPGGRLYRTGDLVSYNTDGTLNFLGRLDRQVKIRGFRVEPEEVEAVLLDCPGVKEAAVVVREMADERQLVGYAVADLVSEQASESWRAYLRQRLPEYMVPSVLVRLEALPRSANGKIDRAALPAPSTSGAPQPKTSVEPANLLELKLLRLWQEIFDRSDLNREDNFFELGGHSLMAARLAADVERLLGHRMPIASIFQAPTVASLARLLQGEHWLPPWTSLVPLQPFGPKPPIFFVHGWGGDLFTFVPLARLLGADQPVYGLQAVGVDGRRPRHTSVAAMAAHYVNEICSFQPQGPYYLGGYSLGGWIAWEVARQLRQMGQAVAMLALVDTQATCRLPLALQLRILMPRLAPRLAVHLRHYVQLPPREWLRFIKGRWGALQFHLRRIPGSVIAPGSQGPAPTLPGTTGPSDHFHTLTYLYRAGAYPGAVDLFRCEDSNPDGLFALQRLATAGVRVHRVTGSHQTMIDRDHVSAFAAVFREALHSAQQRARTGNCA